MVYIRRSLIQDYQHLKQTMFFFSQRAKGDIKKRDKPDPYAYLPLMRQKLNRRKQAKLAGQFSGFMKKAKKGSALGAKQHRRRR